MKPRKTQEQTVREKLEKDGFVSNLWAINHKIWRLGSAIWWLRKDGVSVLGEYGRDLGLSKRHRKNYFYFTEKVVSEVFEDFTAIRPKALAAMERER